MSRKRNADLPTLGSIARAMQGVEGYQIELRGDVTEAVAEVDDGNGKRQKVIVRVTPDCATRTTILVETAPSLEELPTSCFAEW